MHYDKLPLHYFLSDSQISQICETYMINIEPISYYKTWYMKPYGS